MVEAEKPSVVIRPSLSMSTVNADDRLAIYQLKDLMVDRKYDVTAEIPDMPIEKPLHSVAVFLGDGITEEIRDLVLKKTRKAMRSWVRNHFKRYPDAQVSVTVWGADATQHLSLVWTAPNEVQEITNPKLPSPNDGPEAEGAGLWNTFRDFKLSTQIVLIASFVAGLILLLAFSLTDAGVNVTLGGWDPKPAWLTRYNADWYHTHAYIPNVLAGFTGFLIGAPVATIVLATFTLQREERAAISRVNKLTLHAWNKFRDSVFTFASRSRTRALANTASDIQAWHDNVFREYQQRITLARTVEKGFRNRGLTVEELNAFQKTLSTQLPPIDKLMSEALDQLGTYHLQIQWSTMRTNWNVLSEYVRLQRLEWNLPWFRDDYDSEIAHRLVETKHPLTEFVRIHISDRSTPYASMTAAVEVVRRDSQMSIEELGKKMLAGYTGASSGINFPEYYNDFGHHRVDGYETAKSHAIGMLEELRRFVEFVERYQWPRNATKPVATD